MPRWRLPNVVRPIKTEESGAPFALPGSIPLPHVHVMPMIDPAHPLVKMLQRDRRYRLEAYVFVFEALNYAHKTLGLGSPRASEEDDDSLALDETLSEEELEELRSNSRHVSGQELCEAIRQYALEQYGYMARCVLNSWGVHNTGDFGNIVFNLIEIGQMRKTPDDRREDFDDVFDFDEAFRQNFRIVVPSAS